jgi:methylenetetrahydrofolate--tRNA-(uracil-5-)-methyltransferase
MYFVLSGREPIEFPAATAIGSLLRYLREAEPSAFQPMNVNLGIFPKLIPLPKKLSKPERCAMYAERSRACMEEFMRGILHCL